MGKVIAVCRSEKKGTQKTNIESGYFIENFGLNGDAHSGKWHRQVSLLSADKVAEFNKQGAGAGEGAFGENLLVAGIDFNKLPVGTKLRCNGVKLEITQIGKECHSHCQIYQRMGDCIMPREGVFARVLSSGTINAGDEMTVEEKDGTDKQQAAVITLSDKGAKGERCDESGPLLSRRLTEAGFEVIEELLLADDRTVLEQELIRICEQRRPQLILTTGGTGFSPRDITPEATLAVAEREAPGIAEAIRSASLAITPRAMLSRGRAVIRKQTLIINLPGSPKACAESLDVFINTVPHGLNLLTGSGGECAR